MLEFRDAEIAEMTQDLSEEKRKPLLQKQGEFELVSAELAGSYQQVPQFSLGWRIADQKIFDFLEGVQEETFSSGKLPVQRFDDFGPVTETDTFQRAYGCSSTGMHTGRHHCTQTALVICQHTKFETT